VGSSPEGPCPRSLRSQPGARPQEPNNALQRGPSGKAVHARPHNAARLFGDRRVAAGTSLEGAVTFAWRIVKMTPACPRRRRSRFESDRPRPTAAAGNRASPKKRPRRSAAPPKLGRSGLGALQQTTDSRPWTTGTASAGAGGVLRTRQAAGPCRGWVVGPLVAAKSASRWPCPLGPSGWAGLLLRKPCPRPGSPYHWVTVCSLRWTPSKATSLREQVPGPPLEHCSPSARLSLPGSPQRVRSARLIAVHLRPWRRDQPLAESSRTPGPVGRWCLQAVE